MRLIKKRGRTCSGLMARANFLQPCGVYNPKIVLVLSVGSLISKVPHSKAHFELQDNIKETKCRAPSTHL